MVVIPDIVVHCLKKEYIDIEDVKEKCELKKKLIIMNSNVSVILKLQT